MVSDLVLGTLAEEEDIAARRVELGILSELLAEREMEQAELKEELARFQRRYYQTVGPRYVQLDELQARIDEKKAVRTPEEEWLAGRARRRRDQADRSADEYRNWENAPPLPPEPESPSDEAKRLYRRIAGLIHPDRAEDEGSRIMRTVLMAQLNEAYARGDIQGMEDILKTWDASPEAVAGRDRSAELQRLERTVARMRNEIARVETEYARLVNSPLHRLMLRVREGSARGRDLLAELAADLDRRIIQARQELDDL